MLEDAGKRSARKTVEHSAAFHWHAEVLTAQHTADSALLIVAYHFDPEDVGWEIGLCFTDGSEHGLVRTTNDSCHSSSA